ncbi:MAG: sodium/solute symporter [Gammaproteobacteria bacterium]|nr:sodium/solute symporter [Gammaproteobacteria bacterium]
MQESAVSVLSAIDWWVVGIYAVVLFGVAMYVSREKPGHEKNSADYFLASRSLPWWAVGASLVAANISAEQIMGMSGSAYVSGMAIATWEWTAAIALMIIAKYFLPIFREKQIYTIPEFLEKRFDHRVCTVLAIFWVTLFVLVNLTSIMYLGGVAIQALTGYDQFTGMLFLGLFSLAYSLYGGLKAVAFTDLIQVVLLMVGCGVLTWIVLGKLGDDGSVWGGFVELQNQLPHYFDMILASDHPEYMNLPGLSVLLGGIWIGHFSYWGFSQYITQRAIAAKSIAEAQKGVIMASYMKIITPFVIVVPGIAGVLLYPDLKDNDSIYPTLMGLLPSGLLGLTFAALVAAVVSSLSSMINSTSTIFTMDLYRKIYRTGASEKELVMVGRITAATAVVIALLVAEPLLGRQEQAFQFIQEYTGFITPGIVAVFLAAFFWKKANTASVLSGITASLLFTLSVNLLFPDFPWVDRMALAFLVSLAVMYATVWLGGAKDSPKAIKLDTINFGTSAMFNINSLVIFIILTFFYTIWW